MFELTNKEEILGKYLTFLSDSVRTFLAPIVQFESVRFSRKTMFITTLSYFMYLST